MVSGWFITGTDTEIGKTLVSVAMMRELRNIGKSVLGMKPIASGSIMTPEGLRNSDALALQENASEQVPYAWVNPYVFQSPIAPHLAARERNISIQPEIIEQVFNQLTVRAEHLVVEGVGGLLTPLDEKRDLTYIMAQMNLPVILVVGMRLGCLNHALLTTEVIFQRKLPWGGWIANNLSPNMAYWEENLATLEQRLPPPCLGVIPYLANRELQSHGATLLKIVL